jgi:hypothetical protein
VKIGKFEVGKQLFFAGAKKTWEKTMGDSR